MWVSLQKPQLKNPLVSEALTSIPHELSWCKNKIGRAERERASMYKVQVITCVKMCEISKLCKALVLEWLINPLVVINVKKKFCLNVR